MEMRTDRLLKLLQLPSVTQIGIVVPNLEDAILFYRKSFYRAFRTDRGLSKIGVSGNLLSGEPENSTARLLSSVLGNGG